MDQKMTGRPLRAVVGVFHEETNSFNPQVCRMDMFQSGSYAEGPEILRMITPSNRGVIGGILQRLREENAEIIPSVLMSSTSYGPVEQALIDRFAKAVIRTCRENQPVDAVILALHGATEGTEDGDGCGRIVERIRAAVGPETVFTAGFDLHANITERIARDLDFLCGYQTYPHVDRWETGYRAASLALRKLAGERLFAARTMIPMIVPAAGYTTNDSPLRELFEQAHALVADGTLADFSIFQMQPWLDVDPAGSAVVTIGRDPERVREASLALADGLWAIRDEMWPTLRTIDEAIDEAMKPASEPLLVSDFADSPGGGSNGDSVAVALRLIERGFPVRAITLVGDPETVAQAEALGVGGEADFRIGGKITPGMPGPAAVHGRVLLLSDGIYRKGLPGLGRTALIRAENLDFLVCCRPKGCGDRMSYEGFGIDLRDYQLVVVKANTSFRASYRSLSQRIVLADTPGPGSADLKHLPFRRLPKDFYPFREEGSYERVCTLL